MRAVGVLLAGALVNGCVAEVERDRDTEDCIEELRAEGAETTEAQQECMGID